MRSTTWIKSPGNAFGWNKPSSKGYILPGSIYMQFSKRQNLGARNSYQPLPRGLGLSCVTKKDVMIQSGDNTTIPY